MTLIKTDCMAQNYFLLIVTPWFLGTSRSVEVAIVQPQTASGLQYRVSIFVSDMGRADVDGALITSAIVL